MKSLVKFPSIYIFFLAILLACNSPKKAQDKTISIDTLATARAFNDTGLRYVRNEKDYNKGIVFFSKAIAIKPDYSVAYSNRGNAYRILKQFDKAEIDLILAQKHAPDDTLLHRTTAKLYMDAEKFEKAIEELTLVLQMKSLDSIAMGGIYAQRGKAYKSLNNNDLANKDFGKAKTFGYKLESENKNN